MVEIGAVAFELEQLLGARPVGGEVERVNVAQFVVEGPLLLVD